MKSIVLGKVGWRRLGLAIAIGALMCAALALAACGSQASQAASSSDASSSEPTSDVSSSAASPSDASSSADTSSASASKRSTGKQPSKSYVAESIVVNWNDGSNTTTTYTFDDLGRKLTENRELASSDSAYRTERTFTEWDEFGHATKMKETQHYGDDETYPLDIEVTALDVDEDGSVISCTQNVSYNNKSSAEGEIGSATITQTMKYGDDKQICRKSKTKTEYFDTSGALLMSETRTSKFDKDGLQTSFAYKSVDADGAEYNLTADITWTKDDDDKPISYECVLNQDDAETTTNTGDVTLDKSGLISRIDNVMVNGEEFSTTVDIERAKIKNPLPNAYEGWKSFSLTDMIISFD